jgi:hypothetical protein
MPTTTLKSDNGWPASKNPAEIGIKSYLIKGTDIKIRCAKKAGPLLAAFAAEFNEKIEPIDKGALDDWGYCFRMVRGREDRLSNHSSGTAIDLNATKHPLGAENTFTPEKTLLVLELAAKYGLKSGITYKQRKDPMHFEVCLTPKQAKERIIALGLVENETRN